MRVTNLGATLARRLKIRKQAKDIAAGGAAILAGGMMFAGSADAQYFEDFNNLPLRPSVSPSESGGDGTDWTDIPPFGWTRGDIDPANPTPSDGPEEFFGFTFLDQDFWVTTAGDQARSEFTRGDGIVVVADGDEYDDAGSGIEPDLFNVFLRTPALGTTGLSANSVTLNFDSSFRPYDDMTGLVNVSFDGGSTFENVLTLDTESIGGNSVLDRVNEAVSIDLNNPGNGGDIIVEFALATGGNDWWWAIDNVGVTNVEAPPQPEQALRLEVDRDTGEIAVVNGTALPVDIAGYTISSDSGALIQGNWDPIAGRLDSNGSGLIDNDGAWTRLTQPGQTNNLAEASLDAADDAGGGTIGLGQQLALSSEGPGVASGAWLRTPNEDLTFQYISGGEVVSGIVSYTGASLIAGDFDADGDIDSDDWVITRDNQRADLSNLSPAEAYLLGDLDGDLANGHADFAAFKELFDVANGAGSFTAMIQSLAVPEPGAVCLLALGGGLLLVVGRRDDEAR